MVQHDYVEQILKPVIAPLFLRDPNVGWQGLHTNSEFVEDAAPPHGIQGLKVRKEQLNIPTHNRPASSLDLNLIKYCWR